ncbi:MAG TPA: flavin reductase family protein [Bacteroidia bacterium]|nr:flavin reductase family protein [Bacteroidia bacterium]
MKKRAFPLSKVYGLLEPGPVVLLTTSHHGKDNVMTMSWHTMLDFEPPLIGCVVSNRDHTFSLLKASKECVIAIPAAKLVKKVVQIGNTSGRDTDKFALTGLTKMKASVVHAPLIAECYANIECKVADTSMVNRYCFFVLEAVKAWTDPSEKDPRTLHHLGNGEFRIAGKKIRLPSKMK